MNNPRVTEKSLLSSSGMTVNRAQFAGNIPSLEDRSLALFQSIIDSMRGSILVLDAALRICVANRAFYSEFFLAPSGTVGQLIHELPNGPCSANLKIRSLLEDIIASDNSLEDYQVTQKLADGGRRRLMVSACKWIPSGASEGGAGKAPTLLLLTIEDLAKRHQKIESTPPFRVLRRAYARQRHISKEFERPLTQEIAEDAFPGLSLATLYEAASKEADVGGDFFDAFALPRGLVALAIADASGKGLGAAIRTLQVKNVLRAFCREYPFCPNQVLSRLNDYVCDTVRYDCSSDDYYFGGFVCLTLAILDPRTGEGSVVSAGCEPPTILRDDGSFQSIPVHGFPLGIQRETLYDLSPLDLKTGDALLLSTDGITEARNRQTRDFLGYSGMIDLAKKYQNAASVRLMAQQILDGAREFAVGALHDDACLLIARKQD